MLVATSHQNVSTLKGVLGGEFNDMNDQILASLVGVALLQKQFTGQQAEWTLVVKKGMLQLKKALSKNEGQVKELIERVAATL